VIETVRTYVELQGRIATLPPPAEGLVRVFRGQSHDYPLKPSGRRRKVPRADIWSHYLRRLVMYLEKQGVHEDLDREFQLWIVWLQALAQHYGAGSNYLDVTHDLGIATWFAFHTSKAAKLETVVGPPGEVGQDISLKTSWVRLLPHPGPAYLYVLDLKPWSREGLPAAGELVDLREAPALFHSARINVQSGCLVMAEPDQDLKTLATRQFVLEGGFDESPYVSWSLERVFPPPAEDPWYARFLSLPFLITPSADNGGQACLQQSLPVTLYLSSRDAPYVSDIRSRFRHLYPALIHLELDDEEPASEDWWEAFRLADATPVVLEGPQITAHPPVGDRSWNHEVLLSDWVDDVEAYALDSGASVGRARLTNVLVEFSPLEEVAWYDGEVGEQLLRAIWVVRNASGELAVFVFLQNYPWASFARLGPIFLRLGEGRRLEVRGAGPGASWADIATFERFGKAIVSTLVLLRDCSPRPKAAAYPELAADNERGWAILVPVSAGAARLFRASSSDARRHWYIPRHPDGEPFTTARPNIGMLRMEIPSSYADVSAAELQRHIAAAAARIP
jgi:hypothetical protein